MNVEKIIKWRTDDGAEHTTKEMADYHVLTEKLLNSLVRDDRTRDQAQDMLNELSNWKNEIRAWLDADDAMQKAAFQ